MLQASIETLSKTQLVAIMWGLFDKPEGETINLKKDDTLVLAARLQAEGPNWSRSDYDEMIDSLKE